MGRNLACFVVGHDNFYEFTIYSAEFLISFACLNSLFHRDIAAAERPSNKTCHTSSSTSLAASGPVVWADLLDSLLHEIISLLTSFHDLLAFTSTC